MAAYIASRRWVQDADARSGSGEVIGYFIDDETDIKTLPDINQIKETSTAFLPASNRLWVLMTEGWEEIK